MDTLSLYREIIKERINYYSQFTPSYGEIDVEKVFDETNDHYEMIYSGWNGWKRIHGVVLHLDIRNGKIWIQHDGIEHGIANDLLEAGVPAEHIVLGFKHPETRKHLEFAVS
jgi:XisI protein